METNNKFQGEILMIVKRLRKRNNNDTKIQPASVKVRLNKKM